MGGTGYNSIMARISAGLIGVVAAAWLAPTAIAQFGQQFELPPPPRPPAPIPSRPEVPAAPPVASPVLPAPVVPAPQGVRPEIQTQTLPPPPAQRPLPPPPAAAQNPPAQTPPASPGAPQPSLAQPNDATVVEPPTPKIANPTAVFAGLDKITGRITTFDVAIDETVRFGALEVTPRVCYTRPPTELPQTDGFVEVDELTLQGELRRIFTGWMFAASPGLNAVEHPIYDVWLTDCKGGGPATVTVEAAPAEPAPPRPAPPRPRPKPPLQPPPGVSPPAAAPPAPQR